nr:EF-hand domain-containing protein [uncultured Desulfuromonas sp.]
MKDDSQTIMRRYCPVERSYLVIVLLAVVLSCILFTRAQAISSGASSSGQRPLDVLYNAADSDGNGLISESEWHTVMQKRFEEMDTNGDQQVSLEEMAASRDTAKQRFRTLRQSGRYR